MLMIRILNLMMIFYDDLKTLARRSLLSLFLLLAAGLGRPPSYGWWWWWWWLRWWWWSKCYYMLVTTTTMMIITIICPLPPSIIGWAYSVPPTPLLTTSLIVIIKIRKGLKKSLEKSCLLWNPYRSPGNSITAFLLVVVLSKRRASGFHLSKGF